MFITICHLILHDYLFYASREMGRLYETEKYLHNYGLTYVLGLAKAPYTNLVQVPRYPEDLSKLNEQGVYVTPAQPLQYSFAFSTFKMANVNYCNFTPQISSNQVVFGRAKELAPESTFEFFVLSEHEVTLPRWIRLGKWMAKARVEVKAGGSARTIRLPANMCYQPERNKRWRGSRRVRSSDCMAHSLPIISLQTVEREHKVR
jgi:CRISPR type I-D-associated protein Csc1